VADFPGQVLAALERLDSKIDAIRESLAQQRVGLATLETWRQSVQEQHDRFREHADGFEKRLRNQEEYMTRQKVYAGIAAVICSALVSSGVGFLFHVAKR